MDVGVPAIMTTTSAGTLDPDAADVARFKDVLAGHGFLGDEVRKALGAEIGPARLRKDLPLYLRRLAAPTPLHTLIKLFSLGQWIGEAEAAAAVAPIPLEALTAAGLVERGPFGVRALVELAVHRDLVLAHDRHDPERPGLAADHVLGTNAPALMLDSLTVRLPTRSTLDLGCGGGVQSFLAARHCERVIAIDKNPRAVSFARFNARLNGVRNVEVHEGDLFAPVAGCHFDLIVCNPPYVISPESRYIFMDSGRPGDAICEEVVRRAPDHLEEGGFATLLCNWALRAGEDWPAPLRLWVEGSGCDAWLLRGDLQDPLTYAAVWNRGRDPAEYGDAIDRWLAYYREAGIESIAMGAVVLRRRSGARTWVRADVLPRAPEGPCHEQILRVFASQDRLTGLEGDVDILARAFRVVEDHRLTQTLRLRDGEYVIEGAEIRLQGGLGFRGTVDPYTLRLLQRCDGRTPLRDVVDELAQAGGTDRSRLATVVAATARDLAALGFLVPPEDGAGRPARAEDKRMRKGEQTWGKP